MTPRSPFRTRVVATTAWLAAGAGLVVFTALELQAQRMPPTPPEVVEDVIVRQAQDVSGREASFRILLFSDEFRWRLNSYEAIEDGTPYPTFTDEMKRVLNSAKEVICVGASSEEIPTGVTFDRGRKQEEWRAARRADRIALWVRRALSRPIPVRKLNVGHHAPTRMPGDTSDQRRVVIILVLDREDSTDIDQALRAAMTGETARAPIFASLLTKYSLGSGGSFSWVP
jgi:hypothetical protein